MDIDTPPPHQPTTSDLPPSPSPPPPTAISDIRNSDPNNEGEGNENMTEPPTTLPMDANGESTAPRVGRRLRNSLGSGSAGPSRASTPAGGSVTASGGRSTRRNRYVLFASGSHHTTSSCLKSDLEVWHPLSHSLLCCLASQYWSLTL
jgi:hypothetical protein